MKAYTTQHVSHVPAESYPPEEGLAAYADASSGEVWMGHDGGPSLSAPDTSLGNRGRNVMGKWGWGFQLCIMKDVLTRRLKHVEPTCPSAAQEASAGGWPSSTWCSRTLGVSQHLDDTCIYIYIYLCVYIYIYIHGSNMAKIEKP